MRPSRQRIEPPAPKPATGARRFILVRPGCCNDVGPLRWLAGDFHHSDGMSRPGFANVWFGDDMKVTDLCSAKRISWIDGMNACRWTMKGKPLRSYRCKTK